MLNYEKDKYKLNIDFYFDQENKSRNCVEKKKKVHNWIKIKPGVFSSLDQLIKQCYKYSQY